MARETPRVKALVAASRKSDGLRGGRGSGGGMVT
jgi:hypothetical protein